MLVSTAQSHYDSIHPPKKVILHSGRTKAILCYGSVFIYSPTFTIKVFMPAKCQRDSITSGAKYFHYSHCQLFQIDFLIVSAKHSSSQNTPNHTQLQNIHHVHPQRDLSSLHLILSLPPHPPVRSHPTYHALDTLQHHLRLPPLQQPCRQHQPSAGLKYKEFYDSSTLTFQFQILVTLTLIRILINFYHSATSKVMLQSNALQMVGNSYFPAVLDFDLFDARGSDPFALPDNPAFIISIYL